MIRENIKQMLKLSPMNAEIFLLVLVVVVVVLETRCPRKVEPYERLLNFLAACDR